MDNLDEIFLALGFDELAARSRTLIMIGLASMEIHSVIAPTFLERWGHIRQMILRDTPSSSPITHISRAASGRSA